MKHPLPSLRTRLPAFLRLTFCLALLCLPAAAQALSITDDRGREISLSAPAGRVIALYGAFNEILADLGREEIIIARTSADDTPPSILEKPSIGTHLRPNAELILALNPDLIIQLGGRAEALETVRFLEERGLTAAVFNLENFEQLFSVMERLGELTDATGTARQRVTTMREELDALAATWPQTRPRIFFEVRYPNLLAAGQQSMVSEIIHRAGGVNCVENPVKLARLGEEEVLRLDPDIYLMQHGPMNPTPVPVRERPLFRTLNCLAENQVFDVDQAVFSRPGPRVMQAVQQLSEIVHNWEQRQTPAPRPHQPAGALGRTSGRASGDKP
jgi:iron complex transport system substrate-binding protein